MDCKVLNKATASDHFPIPNIDELLDDLHGTCFFPSLTYVRATIKFKSSKQTFIRQNFAFTKAIMSSLPCLFSGKCLHHLLVADEYNF
ncbi:hypothetical protein Syun_014244 [Stephania yunnanensis]|uniref:Uncharacterized protein n=1 Tax=Stephania yunnanensis TaxID=152371 RepID=A0AAP0JJD5_9MAGN